MSKLEELLQGIDIEWKGFGEIASIKRGASPRPIAKYITDDEGGIPWIKIGDTSPNSKYVEKTEQRITVEGSKKSRLLKKGDFIISNSMSFGRPYILNIDGAIHDGWASISNFNDTLIADYLYHYLSSSIVQNYWISKINSGSVSNLNADIIKSLQIPIPCPDNPEKSLKIQQEIVRILDQLTETTNNLKTELENERLIRKKQFEYYLNTLLCFDDINVIYKSLEEVIVSLKTGLNPRKNFILNSDNAEGFYVTVREIVCGEIIFFNKTDRVSNEAIRIINNRSNLEKGDVLFTGTGTVGRVAVIKEDPINWNIKEGVYTIKPKTEIINSYYLAYLLQSQNIKAIYNKKIVGSPVVSLPMKDLRKISIPIPPLEEQERIVKLLDQFNTAHTAIEEEITKEIKLRTQQYEYYREKLLTFPKN